MPRPWSKGPTGERPRFVHAEQTIRLTARDGEDERLSDLCRRIIPSCNLNLALFNGHAQTAWTVVSSEGPAIYYKRRTFAAEEPAYAGHFTVDFGSCPPALSRRFEDEEVIDDPTGVGHTYLPPRTTYITQRAFNALKSHDDKPVVIVLHGLSGGSYEAYVRYALAPLVVTTGEQRGISGGEWEVSFACRDTFLSHYARELADPSLSRILRPFRDDAKEVASANARDTGSGRQQ